MVIYRQTLIATTEFDFISIQLYWPCASKKNKNQNYTIIDDGYIPANINCHNGACDDFNFKK
jgi:hypothetical protein